MKANKYSPLQLSHIKINQESIRFASQIQMAQRDLTEMMQQIIHLTCSVIEEEFAEESFSSPEERAIAIARIHEVRAGILSKKDASKAAFNELGAAACAGDSSSSSTSSASAAAAASAGGSAVSGSGARRNQQPQQSFNPDTETVKEVRKHQIGGSHYKDTVEATKFIRSVFEQYRELSVTDFASTVVQEWDSFRAPELGLMILA